MAEPTSGYDKALDDLRLRRQQLQSREPTVAPPPAGGTYRATAPGGPVQIPPMPVGPGAAPSAPQPGFTPPPPQAPPNAVGTAPPPEAGGGIGDYVTPSMIGSTAAQSTPWLIGLIPHPAARAISRLSGPVVRTILSGFGGGVGERAAGGSFIEGAAKEMVPTAGSEAATKVGVGLVQRMGARRVENRMARGVGEVIEQASPPMAGARTPGQLGNLVRDEGPIRLEMANVQGRMTTQAEGLIGGHTFLDPTRPAVLTAPGVDMARVRAFLQANPGLRMTPDELLQQPWAAGLFGGGGAPPVPRRYTLTELNERLKHLGQAGWPSRHEASPTAMSGASEASQLARRQWRELRSHIEQDMISLGAQGREAYEIWDRGRSMRNAGEALYEVLKTGGWLNPVPSRPGQASVSRLTMDRFQDIVRHELPNLQDRMAPVDYQRLRDIVFRNADPMSGDVPRRGLAAKFAGPIKYTGTEPFSPAEWGRILLNLTASGTLEATGMKSVGGSILGLLVPDFGWGGDDAGASIQPGARATIAPQPTPSGPSRPPSSLASEAAVRANADAAEANAKEKTAAFRRARENAANR